MGFRVEGCAMVCISVIKKGPYCVSNIVIVLFWEILLEWFVEQAVGNGGGSGLKQYICV